MKAQLLLGHINEYIKQSLPHKSKPRSDHHSQQLQQMSVKDFSRDPLRRRLCNALHDAKMSCQIPRVSPPLSLSFALVPPPWRPKIERVLPTLRNRSCNIPWPKTPWTGTGMRGNPIRGTIASDPPSDRVPRLSQPEWRDPRGFVQSKTLQSCRRRP
mmetsp:Transcript_29159/g.60701  ORF Transcript_29159/g.60701 Transcript_29159/m.60701 type:complete len:157 (+) Transcript_29159:191-661(+)